MSYKIAESTRLNEIRQTKQTLYGKMFHSSDSLNSLRMQLNTLLMQVKIAMGKYRTAAIAALEMDVKNHLDLVMPEEDYHVKFDCEPYNGRESVKLLIGQIDKTTGEMVYLPPVIQNGGLVKQVASVSAVDGILSLLKSNCRYLDEALHSGDDTSLHELIPLLTDMCDRGSQIIGIEHRTRMLHQLPHRLFQIIKNRKTSEVVIDAIIDSGGESTTSNIDQLLKAAMLVQGKDDQSKPSAISSLITERENMARELVQAAKSVIEKVQEIQELDEIEEIGELDEIENLDAMLTESIASLNSSE